MNVPPTARWARFMRKNRNLCPNCKVATEPGWHFCLACGQVLIEEVDETPPDPRVLTPRQEKAYRKGKVRCWQCNGKLREPSPACPSCGADLLSPRVSRPKVENAEPTGMISNLPLPMLIAFALMAALTVASMGYLLSGTNSSRASDGDGFPLSDLPSRILGSLFEDDEPFVPDEVPGNAIEGRTMSVSDDGIVLVRVEGHDVDVRLAGISLDFSADCQGDKGLNRMNRILTEGSVVYVLLDNLARLSVRGNAETQSVYIWHYDPETKEVRYVNRELVAGGEAELQPTVLTDIPAAADLIAASARAQEKQRGRYAPGACE